MNIFAVDADPVRAARDLCDQHVNKMILETAQIMCTVAHGCGLEAPYKPTHSHHPCVLWAGASADNMAWLTAHGLALAAEAARRFGREHASAKVIVALAMPLQLALPRIGLQPFAQAMPEQYRGADTIEAYRAYYRAEKQVFKRGPATWTKPGVRPAWLGQSTSTSA